MDLTIFILMLWFSASSSEGFSPTTYQPPTVSPPSGNNGLIIGLSLSATAILIAVIILIICIKRKCNTKTKANEVDGELRRLSRKRRNQPTPTSQYHTHGRLHVDMPGACGGDSVATSCDGDYCLIDDMVKPTEREEDELGGYHTVEDLHHYDVLAPEGATVRPKFPLPKDDDYDHIPEPKFKVIVLKPKDNSDNLNTNDKISPSSLHQSTAVATAFSPEENIDLGNYKDANLEDDQIPEKHAHNVDAKSTLSDSSVTAKLRKPGVIVVENDIYDKSGESHQNNGPDQNRLIEEHQHQHLKTEGDQPSLFNGGLSSPGRIIIAEDDLWQTTDAIGPSKVALSENDSYQKAITTPGVIRTANDSYEEAADVITPSKVVVAENELYQTATDVITPSDVVRTTDDSYEEAADVITPSKLVVVTENDLYEEANDFATPLKGIVAENYSYQRSTDVATQDEIVLDEKGLDHDVAHETTQE